MVAGALAALRCEEHTCKFGHFGLEVDARGIELGLDLIELVGIDLLPHHGAFVVLAESLLDFARLIDEIEHESVVLERMGAVQARQRLYGLNPSEALVHIHGVQQRLIEAGLVFLSYQQHAEIRLGEGVR